MLPVLGRPQPRLELRARVDLIETEVQAAGAVGVAYSQMLELIHTRLNQKICEATLKDTVRRWCPELVTRTGRVRPHADVVVEILLAQHRSKQLQEGLRDGV